MQEEDKTIIEDNDKTILEDNDKTIIENISSTSNSINKFRDYQIQEQLPSIGGEADIYLVEKENKKYILKLYRYGVTPNQEVSEKIMNLSYDYPEYLVKIYDIGYDNNEKRYFELQEFIEKGSLKNININKREIKRFIRNITEALEIVHKNNMLHLDLKPANILVRREEPLETVLTDFGVSSLLDPELTKKLTQIKGTPLYWSPESFTGIVGKEADYWSLGMIILEILLGKHPFANIEQRVIMYTLSTKGVYIPDEINDDFKLILKGLLTREPKKRWRYKQIKQWLDGDKDIETFYHYEKEKAVKKEYSIPYKFQNEQYYSLSQLCYAISNSEENWNSIDNHLNRGYITKWLEENRDYDNAIIIEKIKGEYSVTNLIYNFNKDIEFKYKGKDITINNLFIFLGKSIRRESTELEAEIIANLLKGNLYSQYNIFKKLTKKEDKILELLLKLITNNSIEEVFRKLEIYFSKDNYFIPFIKNDLDLLEFIFKNFKIIKSKDELKNIIDENFIPNKLLEDIKSDINKNWLNFMSFISENPLIKKEIINKKEYINFIINSDLYDYKKIYEYLNTFDNKILNQNQINDLLNNFYLPKDIREKLLSNNFLDLLEVNRMIISFKNFLSKNEIKNLEEEYLLPMESINNLEKVDFEEYKRLVEYLLKLDLISKKELNELPESDKENLIRKNSTFSNYSRLETIKFIDSLKKKNLIIPISLINSIYYFFIHPKVNEFVYVEGGTFEMGSNNHRSNEKPVHSVKLNSFYIGKYEVTQSEYKSVMGNNPSKFKGSNLPVQNVSWWDAIKYCNKKSRNEGLPVAYREDTGVFLDTSGNTTTDTTKVKGYRLPTEAEWEYAARGGNISRGYLYAGGNSADQVAWYSSNSGDKTHTVGSKDPNELGIYDMSGNVWEWCSDWYDEKYYVNSPLINPYNSRSGSIRVIRGGSWRAYPDTLSYSIRGSYSSYNRDSGLGFRLVRTHPLAHLSEL